MNEPQNKTPFLKMGIHIKNLRKKVFPGQGGQARCAEQLGIKRQVLSNWETGRGRPSYKNQLKLAKLLNVSIQELQADGEPPVVPAAAFPVTGGDNFSFDLVSLFELQHKFQNEMQRFQIAALKREISPGHLTEILLAAMHAYNRATHIEEDEEDVRGTAAD